MATAKRNNNNNNSNNNNSNTTNNNNDNAVMAGSVGAGRIAARAVIHPVPQRRQVRSQRMCGGHERRAFLLIPRLRP